MDPTFPPQVAVVESVVETISTPREHQLSGGTDRFYRFSLLGILTATGIFILLFIGVLAWQSVPGWKIIGHGFWSNQFWVYGQSYGVLSLVVGTVLTTLLALLLATPIAIGSALAIVFLIPKRLQLLISSVIGLLAIIPSIVFAIWGVLTLVKWSSFNAEPWLIQISHGHWPFSGVPRGAGIMVGSIILAVMILPIITAMSSDVVAAVPDDVIEGALALGATRGRILRKVILPSCRAGLVGAVSLGMARALGETVAVATVLGGINATPLPNSLLATGSTLAARIVTDFGSGEGNTSVLYCLGVVLFVLVAAASLYARIIFRRNLSRLS